MCLNYSNFVVKIKKFDNFVAGIFERPSRNAKKGLKMCWGGVESKARSTNYLGISEKGGKSELLLA